MSRFKALFSYYGGKSKIAHLYPKPECDTIVEPFAGGAGYSLLYPERRVILVEKNPATAAMWRYLLGNSLETVLRDIPKEVEKGQRVSSMVGPGSDPGLLAVLSASASVGEAGSYCFADRAVTGYGAAQWPRVRARIEYFHPRIKHWELVEGSWEDAPDIDATYYVDPPYVGRLGQRYYCNQVDYKALAQWCQGRRPGAQVIVAENEGAHWLPFEKLVEVRNLRNMSVEVMWHRGKT